MPIFRHSKESTEIPAASERMITYKVVAIAQPWESEAESKESLEAPLS